MGEKSKIEWCDATWNPVQGCSPISLGCKNCYARGIAERFRGVPGHPYEYGFDVRFFPERLSIPSRWKKPKRIFVCSMADLFHEDVSDEFIDKVFVEMFANPRHVFFVLTKRPERLAKYLSRVGNFVHRSGRFDHIWFGVSVENMETVRRIGILTNIWKINRFVSFEPLLEYLDWEHLTKLDCHKIGWMIVGAEAGSKARSMPNDAAFGLLDYATYFGVPYFFKKWSKGTTCYDMPREFPEFRKGESA